MKNKNIFIVSSHFYPKILDNLFKGVEKASESKGWSDFKFNNVVVPGAFEIPGTVKKIIDNENPDLVITLGVLIKGETAHFEYISNAISNSISMLTIQSKIPIIFGIITAYNAEQAIARSSIENIKDNKGYQAMNTGLEMLKLYDNYKK